MKKIADPSFTEECILSDFRIENGTRVDSALFENEICDKKMEQIDFYECKMKHISFSGMQSCSFVDVIFEHCDFSNIHMNECIFRRCEFINCKMTGTEFLGSRFTDVKLISSQCILANLSDTVWNYCIWKETSFREAYLHTCSFSKLKVDTCDFQFCEFYETPLADIDFTTSNINGIAVQPVNLKGMVINAMQAVALIEVFGIVVK